jgi:lipoprotein-anchoring transpeptidase ErfK/SrfK
VTASRAIRRGPLRVAGVAAGVLALAATVLLAPASAVSPAASPAPSGPSAPTPGQHKPPAPPQPPAIGVTVTVTPKSGALVGIASPITAHFSAPVSRRAAAESHMLVYVNGKFSRGAWYWKDSSTAVFRQQSFWPGHSRVEVRLALRGVELSRTGKARFVGGRTTTRAYSVRIGHAFVATVDGKSDRMVVRIDGKVVKTFGVSLGKKGFETRSGIKAVMEKYPVRHMSSILAGITDPNDQYDVQAPWATRITPSGEYVHGAPWAAGRIGRWNGSHGCTNLLTAPAKWFYDTTIPGDAVVTTGTPRTMEFWNGTGAPYNMPWAQWLSRSALKGRAA